MTDGAKYAGRSWRGLFAAVPFSMAVGAISAWAQTASPMPVAAASSSSFSWRQQIDQVCDKAKGFVCRHFGEPKEHHARRGLYALHTGEATSTAVVWEPLEPRMDLGKRAIILVHGLDELDHMWDDMGRTMNARRVPDGVSVLRFEYPNDQSPSKSAEELDAALIDLRSHGVKTVDLVCHSMGGLVARETLTRPTLSFVSEPKKVPKVDRFVMAGTPNHGSALATLQWISELREQLCRWADSEDLNVRAFGNFECDGKGEAARDLLPDSAFLNNLNARPLPSGVRIINIIGRIGVPGDGPIEEAVTLPIVKRVLGKESALKLRNACRDLERAVGDGIVPVKSAWLDGVEESVFVEATHCGLLKGEGSAAPGMNAVLDRLGMPEP